jgi:transposase
VCVLEVNQPDKAHRRRRGKTDALDAEAAARAVLSGRASAVAKTGDGPVEMVRILKMAKDSAIRSRSQAINQLKAGSRAESGWTLRGRLLAYLGDRVPTLPQSM